jgi:hypothetical protein
MLLSVLLAGVLAALAALAALARLYVSRGEGGGYRRLGLLVSLTTFVGVALLFSGSAIETLVGPPAQQGTPFELSLGRFMPYLLVAGMLGATGGLLVLGVLTLGSGILPHWAGAMLFVGSPPSTSSWQQWRHPCCWRSQHSLGRWWDTRSFERKHTHRARVRRTYRCSIKQLST